MMWSIRVLLLQVGTDFPTSILIAAASQALGTSTVTIRDNCSQKIGNQSLSYYYIVSRIHYV